MKQQKQQQSTSSSKHHRYLTQCLTEASASPLASRHGAILVKGGKVIGVGHNDYRPRFEGSGSNPGMGSSAIKCRTPLSVHAEVAAIHNAVAALAGAEKWGKNEGTALLQIQQQNPGRGPSAAARASTATSSLSSPLPPDRRFNQAPAWLKCTSGVLKGHLDARMVLGTSGGFHGMKGKNGNHHQKQKKSLPQQQKGNGYNKHNNKYNKYNNGASKQSSHFKTSTKCKKQGGGAVHPSSDDYDENDEEENTLDTTRTQSKHPPNHSAPEHPINRRIAITPNQNHGASQRDPRTRKKHPKLYGADLYVARLGKANSNPCHKSTRSNSTSTTDSASDLSLEPPSPTLSASTASTGSLHDELTHLTNRRPSTSSETILPACESEGYSVAESRPCYRCVAAMHAAGIKRVFWTNAEGEWEGAKVRDLVDEVCGTGAEAGDVNGEGGMPKRVFVTKGEVLLLLGLGYHR